MRWTDVKRAKFYLRILKANHFQFSGIKKNYEEAGNLSVKVYVLREIIPHFFHTQAAKIAFLEH
jgi:hypothetical protein